MIVASQQDKALNYSDWFGGGSGCGSLGRAVTSNTRSPRFKSRHWQNVTIEKTKIKKKRPGMAHLFLSVKLGQ